MMEVENNNDNISTDKLEEKTPAKKVRRQPTQEELNHPLHGVKLATVLETLVEVYGWKYLAQEVNIKCFKHDPSIKVSLKFLRKFKWAREHVQDIYVDMVEQGIDQKVKKDRS